MAEVFSRRIGGCRTRKLIIKNMRYLLLLTLLGCAAKKGTTETQQQTAYETSPTAMELFEEEELFDDLPEAGNNDEDEE